MAGDFGYKVTGVVKNITKEQQDDVRLAAALFDANGNLLGALKGSVDVGIAPGSEAGFELSYPDVPSEVIKNISTIEVKSYGWSF
ncbi:FxLYD domain-containing protein [Lysinibacillus sphaericus]|uniref:FxLYD domain-containing protein n=1 Tax=Lysinibacillus sphaericus TaxID=1421 RepID=UPI001C8DE921